MYSKEGRSLECQYKKRILERTVKFVRKWFGLGDAMMLSQQMEPLLELREKTFTTVPT